MTTHGSRECTVGEYCGYVSIARWKIVSRSRELLSKVFGATPGRREKSIAHLLSGSGVHEKQHSRCMYSGLR